MVHDLLESLYNDLDKKLSAAMSIENEGDPASLLYMYDNTYTCIYIYVYIYI
jgi:hypothetical protein